MTQHPEKKPCEWEREFDRLSDWGKFPMGEYHTLLGEHLFDSEWYPESEYELDPEKIKRFIRSLLATARTEEKASCDQRVAEAVEAERERCNAILNKEINFKK